MNVTQYFSETNILNHTENFYCDGGSDVELGRGYAFSLLKYGSVLVALGALGYGAFELVSAFIVWALVAVPLILATVLDVVLKVLGVLATLVLGYYGFMVLWFLINGKQTAQPKRKALESKPIDVEVLEDKSVKMELSLKELKKVS